MTADATINKSKISQSVTEQERTKVELNAVKEKLRAKELDIKKYFAGTKQLWNENRQLKNEAKVS